MLVAVAAGHLFGAAVDAARKLENAHRRPVAAFRHDLRRRVAEGGVETRLVNSAIGAASRGLALEFAVAPQRTEVVGHFELQQRALSRPTPHATHQVNGAARRVSHSS